MTKLTVDTCEHLRLLRLNFCDWKSRESKQHPSLQMGHLFIQGSSTKELMVQVTTCESINESMLIFQLIIPILHPSSFSCDKDGADTFLNSNPEPPRHKQERLLIEEVLRLWRNIYRKPENLSDGDGHASILNQTRSLDVGIIGFEQTILLGLNYLDSNLDSIAISPFKNRIWDEQSRGEHTTDWWWKWKGGKLTSTAVQTAIRVNC